MTQPAAIAKTNTLALVGFIAAFVIPIVGIVLGAMAINQISQTREGGRGLARWAVIVGLIGTVIQLAFFTVWLSLFVPAISGATFVR